MENVEAAAGAAMFSPETSNMLIILSLAINVILLFAFAYLYATRRQEEQVTQLENSVRKLTNNVKILEKRLEEKNPRVVHTLPDMKPFGMGADERNAAAEESESDENDEYAELWAEFVSEYNLLAASMNVPRAMEACEKFVYDHGARMMTYSGGTTFIPAIEVGESNYWAWKIPDTKNIYAMVPNPMRPCDKVVYESGGLKLLFEMDYNGGVFRKYIVERPAILAGGNEWQVQHQGELKLEK